MAEDNKPSKVMRDQDFRTLYANQVRVTISPEAGSLSFALIEDATDDNGDPLVFEQVRVFLPLQKLKALSLITKQLLAKFEKEHGEIQLTPPKKDEEGG